MVSLALTLLTSLIGSCRAYRSESVFGAGQSVATVDVEWDNVLIESKTTLTLQEVVNPPLLANSSIRDNALASLRLVAADLVRFVPWFPYPKLAVPEIDPPVIDGEKCTTSWDFSYADQLLGGFLDNTPNYQSWWLSVLDTPYDYPNDVNAIDWDYNKGTELRDSTLKEITDYYERLLSWYTAGGFTDECGIYHESGHHWPIEYWEVLNEPEFEHNLSPALYIRLYDSITAAIAKVCPNMQFVGLALASRNSTWVEEFLDHSNHAPGTPLDWISYHFYATPSNDTTVNEATASFAMADNFIGEVQQLEEIRKRLSPTTNTTLNEIGTMDPLGSTTVTPDYTIPDEYWVWSSGVFAYVFSKVAALGIDALGESQLVGYPGQYPSVSMVDWETGLPNARLRVLQLLQQRLGPGNSLVVTNVAEENGIHAQGFVGTDGKRKVLLINKEEDGKAVQISGGGSATAEIVHVGTGGNTWEEQPVSAGTVTLPGFATAVLTFA